MTPDEPIASKHTLRSRLKAIINEASQSGIEIEGAFPIINGEDDQPDWDLEIVELAKNRRKPLGR